VIPPATGSRHTLRFRYQLLVPPVVGAVKDSQEELVFDILCEIYRRLTAIAIRSGTTPAADRLMSFARESAEGGGCRQLTYPAHARALFPVFLYLNGRVPMLR
jgi:hypothetical protein